MTLMSAIGFGLRMLRKNPAVSIAAMLATGLGIGATTAMFSIVDGVLLRPLPFQRAERLVNVWESNLDRNIPRMVAAPGNYYDWRGQTEVLQAIGAYQGSTFNLSTTDGEPDRFVGAICDPGFFSVLRVEPVIGRTFTEEENQPGHDGVVILGYNLWQQRFGGDNAILGRTLRMDGQTRTVIGVMPKGFEYPPLATIWAPLALDSETRERRDFHRLRVIGRLRDGISLERARRDFQALGARLAQQYPDLDKDESIVVNGILEDMVGNTRPALLVLLGAVSLVLLIACADVANLLLAKASGRRREMAIRLSMGAGRSAIVKQMLVESLTLSICGGALGLLMAYGAFRWLVTAAPANVPRLNEAAINGPALALALLLSVLTGVLFGLAPALHASRTDVHSLLKEGGRSLGTRSRLRSGLVVGQVAVTLMLLAGAGLLLRSFYELAGVDAGFDPQHVMTMRLAPAAFRYRDHNELQIQLARNILHSVAGVPGVRKVAISTDIPLAGNPIYIMRFEGRPPVMVSQAPLANYFAVTPGFFEVMGMQLLIGRGIEERDSAQSPLVAVVNQTLAERYFPGQDPIGKRLEIAFRTPPEWREIVGVVKDVRSAGLDQDTPVQVYTAYMQEPTFLQGVPPSAISVVARTQQDPAAVATPMKAAILSVDRTQPVFAVQPMTELVSKSIAQRKLSLMLLAFFAIAALVLAAVGLYGVMSYMVTQRTGEIGIRMALGAGQSQLLLLVQRQGMILVAGGLAAGLCGALLLTRFLDSLLFHVQARDPLTLGIAAAVLLAVGICASWLPARRASKVDPMVALRNE